MRPKENKQPETHRLFIALLPDLYTVNQLTQLQKPIKGKKTSIENFHLTLMFLGNQPKTNIAALKSFIDRLPFEPFDLKIDQYGFFSKLKISWAGFQQIPASLAKLHKIIWNQMVPDYVNETKYSFRPHITLARKALPPPLSLDQPFIWHINRLALMESIISDIPRKSASYRILHEKHA